MPTNKHGSRSPRDTALADQRTRPSSTNGYDAFPRYGTPPTDAYNPHLLMHTTCATNGHDLAHRRIQRFFQAMTRHPPTHVSPANGHDPRSPTAMVLVHQWIRRFPKVRHPHRRIQPAPTDIYNPRLPTDTISPTACNSHLPTDTTSLIDGCDASPRHDTTPGHDPCSPMDMTPSPTDTGTHWPMDTTSPTDGHGAFPRYDTHPLTHTTHDYQCIRL
jgi:hypothetical protein